MDLIISNEKKNCKCKKRCECDRTAKMNFSSALSEFDALVGEMNFVRSLDFKIILGIIAMIASD